jgi:transketolase
MRNAFVQEICELAERDPRIVLLTGDLGFAVLEPFAERFPDRFFNAGGAEQNMIGVATGLAESGMIPFAYSIATFASMRPYEFIRNGPVLHQLPVRIVGVGGGFDYGHNGATHYALEDVGVLRLQRGLTVVVPADDDHARAALAETVSLPGPVYYRVSKGGPAVPGLNGRFELGRMVQLRAGADIALVAIGPIVDQALIAAEQLAADGIDAAVALVSSFNPAPVGDLADLLSSVPLALTIESHYLDGGLGTLAAEVIAENGLGTRLIRRGVSSIPRGLTGSQAFLEDVHGISAPAITATVASAMGLVR